jgi:hypothetical protein
MTGGLGFVTDMMNRDKANRALLKDIKEWRKKSVKAHIPKASLADIKCEEDRLENKESTLAEIKNIRNSTRKHKIEELVFGTILVLGLLTLFTFLLLRYII